MKDNKEKDKQLGMCHGTAVGRLRKMILFSVLKRHKENICFRCGKEITEVSQLSVEHKKAWLHNDVKLFWDIDNIAFSHLSCNSKNHRCKKAEPIVHGTSYGYDKRKCRCIECKKAKSIRNKKRKRISRYGVNGSIPVL